MTPKGEKKKDNKKKETLTKHEKNKNYNLSTTKKSLKVYSNKRKRKSTMQQNKIVFTTVKKTPYYSENNPNLKLIMN